MSFGEAIRELLRSQRNGHSAALADELLETQASLAAAERERDEAMERVQFLDGDECARQLAEAERVRRERDEARAEIARLIEAGCRPLPADVADLALTLVAVRHLLADYDYVSTGARDAAIALIDERLGAVRR